MSQEDFDHAVKRGVLFKPSKLVFDHDAAVKKVRGLVESVDAAQQADLFLASLSSQRLDFRIGLGALAALRLFPDHSFSKRPDGPYCAVCGLKQPRTV